MPNFALRTIRGLVGYQTFEELVVDGVRPLKQFRDDIKDDPALMSELRKIFTHMEQKSKGLNLPGKYYHPLDNPTRGIAEFEFKSKHIRIYCFKSDSGKIIVYPTFKKGKKNDENNEIQRFRNIKNTYLDSLKNEKDRTASK